MSRREGPAHHRAADSQEELLTPIRPTPVDTVPPWVLLAARAADDKLGADTIVLDVGDVLAVTDYFVITSGANARQVRTIVEEVERRITEAGGPKPVRIEGLEELEWVLVDFGIFVVHVFAQEQRDFYQLERLWSDRPQVDWRAGSPRGITRPR